MANNEKFTHLTLPNLLQSTTYSLNKSNSKRVLVGLEHSGGYYKVVVKLCSCNSPSKYVTFDVPNWKLFTDQLSSIDEYLRDDYKPCDYSKQLKIYLPQHDLNLTLSYGSRAIAIDERPVVKTSFRDEEEAADENKEPASKKMKKYDYRPCVVLQKPSFDGIKEMRECIDERIKVLEENAGFVNRSVDLILESVKNAFAKESEVDVQNTLKDLPTFKQFYTLNRIDIESHVTSILGNALFFSPQLLKITLSEIYVFELKNIVSDLRSTMSKD